MLFGLVVTETEVGVKFLEILQAEFMSASNTQGRNYGDDLVSMPSHFSNNMCHSHI